MNRKIVILTVILLGASFIHADVLVTEKVKVKSWLLGVLPVGKSAQYVNQYYIGDGRLAALEGHRVIIVDTHVDSVWVVNKLTRTVVAASLPLNVEDLIGFEVKQRYEKQHTTGYVKSLEKTKTINGQPCQRYRVTYWAVSPDLIVEERYYNVWTTNAIEMDYDIYMVYQNIVNQIYNRSLTLQVELTKVEGLQMRADVPFGIGGWVRKSRTTVTGIAEVDTPPGAYTIPTGYTRKPRLTLGDLGLE